MGMSDSILYPRYMEIFDRNINREINSIAFLGFSSHQHVTSHISSKNPTACIDFYDIELDGDFKWDINSNWDLKQKYDLVVCLRCPYFAKDPKKFLEKCHNNLNEGGYIFIDWGLGDHWRFSDYKIGWVKNEEHEHAYVAGNYLWSTVWDDSFLNDDQFKIFLP